VVRVSGPASLAAIEPFFDRHADLQPRQAVYGRLNHPDLGDDVFDDCVVTFFKSPASATGEDLVEISIHGGEYLQKTLLKALTHQPGVRLADPGEFTLRAFLNGRIDLTRAEAVADLIHARDVASHRAARQQLHGALAQRLESYRQQIMDILVQIEVELDFSEHEIDFTPLEAHSAILDGVLADVRSLLKTHFYGRRIQEGFRVPLIGVPNAGKSTLFNALLGHERAIVNDTPGTTRDTIEASFSLGAHTLILVDTAGVHSADDQIEQSGIDRSLEELQRADLVLLVNSTDTPGAKLELPPATPAIAVHTKCDTDSGTEIDGLPVSGKTAEGLDELLSAIQTRIDALAAGLGDGVVLTHYRHSEILERFADQLQAAQKAVLDGLGPEYVAADLRESLHVLGELTGETTPEDILNTIFAGFCVGK